ncbi:MAG TPA: PAS domain S-box protein [Steroidobacteraceae bacterium]|nr:PAS domain S-box protein [Steroidobacteraceae bacterium]
MLRNVPIRRKMMLMLMITSGTVLLLTCLAFITYEYHEFRRHAVSNITTLAKVLATNSTAALAFDNTDDANDVLQVLKAEPSIVAAALYDRNGHLFARYPRQMDAGRFPHAIGNDGYQFASSALLYWMPVKQDDTHVLGKLYLQADQHLLEAELRLYMVIAAVMTAIAFLIAYLIARVMQGQISRPLLALSDTANAVARDGDYSVRATKIGRDEFGQLTDVFNRMLEQIQRQDQDVSEGREQLHAIIDTASEGIITVDDHGIIESFNLMASRIFGYAASEVLGKNVRMLMPDSYAVHHDDYIGNYLRTGEKKIIGIGREVTGLRKGGSTFPMDLAVVEVRLHGKRKFSGFVRDITQRKEADAKLQAQLSRLALMNRITRAIAERQDLQSIFQVAVRSVEQDLPLDFACMCLYDPVTQQLIVTSVGVQSASLALELAMPEQARIAIDQNGLSRCVMGYLVYEHDLAAIQFPFARRLAGGGLGSLVAAPLLAESKVFGALLAARQSVNGFNAGEVEFLGQLSEHVALAAHSAQLYGALQKAYDDLRRSQQTILQQERLSALGQIASGVAHDINNAVSPITLYTESLLQHEPGLSERTRKYLGTIQRAVEDVALTVSRMREFYRVREPQLDLAQIDLNVIAQQVIELTRARWHNVPQERGAVIELKTEFTDPLPKVMGAENEIRDALTNLIFNAADAMPEGGTLMLRTSVVIRDEQGAQDTFVCIEVSDSGIGMDETTRKRCLEPFFTTKGERGTGLGLAMVYGMVKRHSAELQIDSEPGRGTTIRLIFATAVLSIDDGQPQMALQRPPRPLSLLIIDDDPVIIESLTEVLRRDGHQVTSANGGAAGIEAFRSALHQYRKFDVVITDLGMPYVDGRAVAAAVKTASSATPVILLTGWGHRLQAENDRPAHVDRILNKPPKMEELRRTLAALVMSATTPINS